MENQNNSHGEHHKKNEQIEWSGSTPLVKVLKGGWKEYPIYNFHTDFIIFFLRTKETGWHIVFHQPINSKHGTKVFQPA